MDLPTQYLTPLLTIGGIVFGVVVLLPLLVNAVLRNVDAGTIRLVSWLHGRHGHLSRPGQVQGDPAAHDGHDDLEQGDQRRPGHHRPDGRSRRQRHAAARSRCSVLASAIVSVGDTDELIKTAANRFFSKTDADQLNTLTDLLSSSGRRAINLLTHDQLFSARTDAARRGRSWPAATRRPARAAAPVGATADRGTEDDDDPLAVIIRKACSRELTDLGPDLQLAQHQGRAVRGGRSAAPAVGGRSAGERRHRVGPAGASREGGAARGRARDLRQAARARADQGVERGADRAGGGEEAGSAGPAARARSSTRRRSRRPGPMPSGCGSRRRPRPRPRRSGSRPWRRRTAESIQQGERGDPRGRRGLLPLSPDRDAAADRARRSPRRWPRRGW